MDMTGRVGMMEEKMNGSIMKSTKVRFLSCGNINFL